MISPTSQFVQLTIIITFDARLLHSQYYFGLVVNQGQLRYLSRVADTKINPHKCFEKGSHIGCSLSFLTRKSKSVTFFN